MKNRKVIVINGFQRGGTNILYNIFQSHPLVCSPKNLETGEIISQSYRLRDYPKAKLIGYLIRRGKLKFYSLLNKKLILNSFLLRVIGNFIDSLFFKYKKKNYWDPYNKYKYENIPYSKKKVKNSILCIKSVHYDIELTDFFSRFYPEIYFIGLVRDGYALCEGWIRRGKTAEFSGKRYRKYCEMMIKDRKKLKNYMIIKFEDVLRNPFEMATKLYKFTQLEPVYLKKLRLQVKKVLTDKGHRTKYGKEFEKYWFNNVSINDLIEPNINKIQIQNLSESDKKIFEEYANPILKYFKYKKDN